MIDSTRHCEERVPERRGNLSSRLRCAVILLALAFAVPALADDYTIKVVTLANTNDEDYDGALAFEEYVERESDGAIEVRIFVGGQLCGNNMECLMALQGGVMEVFMCALGGLVNWFPEVQVLDLPYMFPNDEVVERVYAGPFKDELGAAILEKTGLRLVCMSNTGGWRNIVNARREVRTPEDLKGLKLRTIASPIQIELTKALGASPTPIPWPELYTSLATGVVDGSKNGITDIVGMNFHEHVKYFTEDRHAYMTAMWMMNNDAYQELPDELREVVDEGFRIVQEVTTKVPKEKRRVAIDTFVASGGKVYTPSTEEKARFVAAAAPVRQWYIDRYGDYWLTRLDAAIEEAEDMEAFLYDKLQGTPVE